MLFVFFITGCTNSQPDKPVVETNKVSFFPVTSYFKGQILDIRNKGINPLKYTTSAGKTDSAWLKIDSLEKELREFLTPVIDTTNWIEYYKETRFNDLTTDSYTFTYDPKKNLPDTCTLTHWDIYIDPEKNSVRKIYLVKKLPDHKLVQLTWYHNKYCKATYLREENDNKTTVLKEEKITWNF